MADPAAMKAAVQQAIAGLSEELRALSMDIHAHPELNFEEVHAHEVLTGTLERHGFRVERGAYGMPTAFRAEAGSGGPVVAVLCEYDALPGIGHACGHNLIAASGIAAGLALREALAAAGADGTVVVLGSPAEEGGGGKVIMVDRGAFAGVDAAMMLHPAPEDGVWPNIIAVRRLMVTFHGRAAHAAAFPHEGLNALDALVLGYNALAMLRQQLTPDVRVHGMLTHGGVRPNIIPDRAAADFIVRAQDQAALDTVCPRVLACFEGAAVATGCRLEVEWGGQPYADLRTNDPLAEAYVANARALGRTLPGREAGMKNPGSTDMGNVSYVVPSIHPMFGIRTEAGNHTPEFTAAAGTPQAHQEMLTAATALAMTAVDYYTSAELRAAARAAFDAMM